ncbi:MULTISPECIES: chalcone isomerase family protein [Roseateles]|uniref:Chalcone isomerase family protein n=1 Tax=Pelomonas caseinilytica TaxID=2906763 RepID=A0ABS8X689_9BURK|nr:MULTISPECIES: chalcone isomerase family protein [unclassified Roseateles]MCE4535907.1 chalcone isomerase family protein [Pelomonas sp. P7]HEV6968930.1 chalcone isomerase family protein [Roseateles sp.]
MIQLRALAASARIAALAAGLALAQQAGAAPTVNKFEPSAQLGGSTLQLNGKGTRVRLVFKAYDMALYTPRRVSTPAELLALPGPKRLQFTALRELPGTELGRLFLRGMSDNTPAAQMTRHTLATTRLIEVFSGKAKLMPGDSFAMDFVPGKGTQFYIQGQPQGEPVGDDEFFTLVLRIWFGDSPADVHLRDALLDGGKD